MLFNDPYKDIHGQTVENTIKFDTDTAKRPQTNTHINNANIDATASVERARKVISTVIIVIGFYFIISTVLVAFIALTADYDDSTDGTTWKPYGSSRPSTYGLKDKYTLDELAEEFVFGDEEDIAFTATDEFTLEKAYGYNTIFLRYAGSPNDNLVISIEKSSSVNYDLLRANNTVVTDIDGFDDELDLAFYRNNGYRTVYQYYTPFAYSGKQTEYIHISYTPQNQQETNPLVHFGIIKKALATVSNQTNSIITIKEKAQQLVIPIADKIPDNCSFSEINIKEKRFIFDQFTVSGENRVYRNFLIYYQHDLSGFDFAEQYKDGELVIDIYKDRNDTYLFKFNPNEKTEYKEPIYVAIQESITNPATKITTRAYIKNVGLIVSVLEELDTSGV